MFQVGYPSAYSAQKLVDDVYIVLVLAQPSLDSLGSAPGGIVSSWVQVLVDILQPVDSVCQLYQLGGILEAQHVPTRYRIHILGPAGAYMILLCMYPHEYETSSAPCPLVNADKGDCGFFETDAFPCA